MNDNDRNSIILLAGSTELLEQMKAILTQNDVVVYTSRSAYEAVQILLTKQVDAVFVTSGFSHAIESIRLFSTIPCSYIVCGNCLSPGGADFLINSDEFEVEKMPEYLEQMTNLNAIRTKFKGIVWFSRLRIDIDNYTVEYGDKNFKLKPLEIKLLFYLAKHLNRVISRNRLLSAVWGYEEAGATRTLDVHIMSLRSLLSNNKIPLEIQTYRGEGYKLFDTETMGGLNYFS
jgi:DNA-binding response OmpR family regulator